MATIDTTNVLIADIRDVLLEYGGTVTNDTTTFFTTDAKINMWSKYKPVVSTTLFFDESDDKRWLGDDGKCGLTIPTYSLENLKTALENDTAGWTYTPPSGGTSEPMRLGDFRGYYPDAVNPVGEIVTNGLMDSDGYVTFSMDVATIDSDYNLTYSQIKIGGNNGTPLSQYYLGIYMTNGTTHVFETNTVPIGSEDSFDVKVDVNAAGKWKFAPFLSSKAQTGTGVSGTFLSANKSMQTVNIVSSSTLQIVQAFGMWNVAGTSIVNINVALINNSSSSFTFSSIKVYLVRTSGSEDADEGETVKTVSYSSSVTVSAKSTKWITVSDISHSRSSSYIYWLGGYATSVDISYNQVEEEAPES